VDAALATISTLQKEKDAALATVSTLEENMAGAADKAHATISALKDELTAAKKNLEFKNSVLIANEPTKKERDAAVAKCGVLCSERDTAVKECQVLHAKFAEVKEFMNDRAKMLKEIKHSGNGTSTK